MMFTDMEIELVRKSWEPVSQDPAAAAALFYGNLFEAAPGVRPLFPEDMKEQGLKLMQMIGVAVNSMHRIEEVIPALQEMGVRHRDYGAEPEHYPVVGSALIDTLAAALGDAFTKETQTAWEKTYATLASVMLEA